MPRSVLLVLLFAAVLSVASPPSVAVDLDCEIPGDRRLLRLELPGEEHLCEVSVIYRDGERRMLWYADNDSLFCSEKLEDLAARYSGEFGFSCSEWPASDGLSALSAPQRRALDRELLARLEGADAPPASIRVAVSDTVDGSALVAVQWLGSSAETATDAISLYTDDTATDAAPDSVADWQQVSGLTDLQASLPEPADGARIERALLTDIASDGSLALTTIVTPPGGPDDTLVCRGRQRIALDGDDRLSVRTPHRHACEPLVRESDAG